MRSSHSPPSSLDRSLSTSSSEYSSQEDKLHPHFFIDSDGNENDTLCQSPEPEPISDAETDSTLSDVEDSDLTFGHPLERMQRTELLGGGVDPPSRDGSFGYGDSDVATVERFVGAAAIGSMGPGLYSLKGQLYETSITRNSSISNLSSTPSCVPCASEPSEFDEIIDHWIHDDASRLRRLSTELVIFDPSTSTSSDAFMIKCFPSNSLELSLIGEANEESWRRDPWNPVPHILHEASRDGIVILGMERLMKYNEPPLLSVANYIDFFRQILEGLTFLHEHNIAVGSCADPHSFMVDLSSARGDNGSSTYADVVEHFDRSTLPVRYYFTDFSKAGKINSNSEDERLTQDIRDCAQLFDILLAQIKAPQVTSKLQSLTKSMRSGTFGADNSRKLFEALCKSMDGNLFSAVVDGTITMTQPGTLISSTSSILPRYFRTNTADQLAPRETGAATPTCTSASRSTKPDQSPRSPLSRPRKAISLPITPSPLYESTSLSSIDSAEDVSPSDDFFAPRDRGQSISPKLLVRVARESSPPSPPHPGLSSASSTSTSSTASLSSLLTEEKEGEGETVESGHSAHSSSQNVSIAGTPSLHTRTHEHGARAAEMEADLEAGLGIGLGLGLDGGFVDLNHERDHHHHHHHREQAVAAREDDCLKV